MRANPRALGTNPRAQAQQAAEAVQRIELLEAARQTGARTASVDPHTTPDELRQRLLGDAQRDPRHGWDRERIEAAVAGFTEARTAAGHSEEPEHVTSTGPVDPREALRSAREALRRSQDRSTETEAQLSFDGSPL